MSDLEKTPTTLTRDELYARVWAVPMSRLASEFGISGNGLAKICDRLKVPYPPRGYWAKKQAGKKVLTYRLPAVDQSVPATVTISPTPVPAPKPELPPALSEQVEAVQAEAASITVPERLLRPHPIVRGWLDEHDRRKKEARNSRDPWERRLFQPTDITPMDHRRHRFLDTLFKQLDKHGANVRLGDRNEMISSPAGEPVSFQLREKHKQVRRPLTADEKRWRSPGERDWRQELQPSGRLLFAIQTYLPQGLTRQWLETEARTMESMLPEILATIIAAGPLLHALRLEREELERQRQIREHERYLAQQRRKREENRWRLLVSFAHERRDAQLALELVKALKSTAVDLEAVIGDRSTSDWLAWAEERARSADPVNHGVAGIFGAISEVNEWTYRE